MSFVITFLSVLAFWLLLSGEFKMILLFFAVVYSVIVTLFTHDLFVSKGGKKQFVQFFRFLAYIPWLLKEIFIANFQVAKIVLSPKMPINPDMIRVKSDLKTDIGLTVLANSITLTPGTVTVDIDEGELLVHVVADIHKPGIHNKDIEKKVLEIEGVSDV